MYLQTTPVPTLASLQQAVMQASQPGARGLNALAHVIHAGFHPAATEDLIRESHVILYRSPQYPVGLLNQFQSRAASEFQPRMEAINRASAAELHGMIDHSLRDARGHMEGGRFGQMAVTMATASLAVWCALEKKADRRAELEDLIGDFPTPLLRMPPMLTLNAIGLMHYWDRCDGLWVLEDLSSQNINRIAFGQVMVATYAQAEAKSSSQSTQLRDIYQGLPVESWKVVDPRLRPEKHFQSSKNLELLRTLLLPGTRAPAEAKSRLVEMVGQEVDHRMKQLSPLALRRLYLEEAGGVYRCAAPLRMNLKVILGSIDQLVAIKSLSVEHASGVIEDLREVASILINELWKVHSVPTSLFEMPNPYANYINFSMKKDGPKGTA